MTIRKQPPDSIMKITTYKELLPGDLFWFSNINHGAVLFVVANTIPSRREQGKLTYESRGVIHQYSYSQIEKIGLSPYVHRFSE